jgi:hypothetical protein
MSKCVMPSPARLDRLRHDEEAFGSVRVDGEDRQVEEATGLHELCQFGARASEQVVAAAATSGIAIVVTMKRLTLCVSVCSRPPIPRRAW